MGKTLKAIGRLALTVGGYVVAGPIGAVIGTAIGSVIFKIKPPRTPLSQLDRLNASLNPTAPRTGAFGETALGTDIRYIYPSGTDQRYVDYIIAVAAHKVESIDELWIEDRLAWSSSSGYASWTNVGGARLTVATRTEGTSGNAINIGGAWTGSARLTGCAYIHVRIDRQGTKKTDSPFSGGLASRLTIKGKGMPLYDPRLDTTRGGSGSHRADDQTTWATTTARNNPALQILAYLIGWKIAGKLSVGRGVPLDDIDFDSFITAANACDEDIDLAGGGTHNRYETAGMFSEGDDADTILNALAVSCNAELRDYNGRIGLFVKVNDLAVPVASFSDQNILSGFRSSTGQVSAIQNVVRGRYTDPSNNALYQLVDYPEVSLTSVDGIERVLPLDLPYVQEGRRAQRIAKQALQRAQYSDTYEAEFDVTALKCGTGDVVEISFEALGWTDKLFRVISQSLTQNGRIAMQLRVEDASIYAWDEDEAAPVTAAAPTTFDPLNAGAILAAEAAAETANWSGIIDDDPERPKPEDGATNDARGSLLSGPQAANDPAVWGGSSAIWEHFANGPTSGWGPTINSVCILAHLSATASLSSHLIDEPFALGSVARIYHGVRFAHGNSASIDLKTAIWFYDADDNFISGGLASHDLPRDAVAGEYVSMQFASPVPAGAVFGRVGFWRDTGSAIGEYLIDQVLVSLSEQGATVGAEWASGVYGDGKPDDNADVTIDNAPSLTLSTAYVEVQADYQGNVLTGQLPRTVQVTRKKGDVDVTSSATKSITPAGCTAAMNSDGLIEITAVSGIDNTIALTTTFEGVELKAAVKVKKILGLPPSGTSAGGSGATSAYTNVIETCDSASYGSADSVPLTVTPDATGSVTVSFPGTFSLGGNTSGSGGLYALIQYKAASSGTWLDAGSEELSDEAAVMVVYPGGEVDTTDGIQNIERTITSLTNGIDYNFRIRFRNPSGTRDRYVLGILTATVN